MMSHRSKLPYRLCEMCWQSLKLPPDVSESLLISSLFTQYDEFQTKLVACVSQQVLQVHELPFKNVYLIYFPQKL